MKINRILAYRVELPLAEGSYKWSGGKAVTVFDSTVVAVETDNGVTGYGEVCPLGPFYLPAYASGVRAGIAELGPHLLGEDPTQMSPASRSVTCSAAGMGRSSGSIEPYRRSLPIRWRGGSPVTGKRATAVFSSKWGVIRTRTLNASVR